MSRLRTPSAAPWDGDSTPKLPLGGIQHCQPASSSSSRAVLWPYCAASYWQPGGRAPRAPRRAHGSQHSNEYCRAWPPQGCRAAVLASQGARRLLWLLRRRPLRWPLLRWPASGTAAGGRCTRAFPRGRRRAARAQLCWHTARVVTQPRRTGGAVREARVISYFQGWIRPFQGYTFENPQRPTLLVTLSISRLANTKCCDRGSPISFFLSFFGPCGHPSRGRRPSAADTSW